MTIGPDVPRLAERLVSLCVSESDRGSLLGDLEERFLRRAEARGRGAARRWYWSQTLGIVAGLAPRRLASFAAGLSGPGTTRAAVRSLLRSPASSLACAATLAIGIAAPLAMFALADGVTSSLPGDSTDRVVRLSRIHASGRIAMGFSWSTVEAFRDAAIGPDDPLTSLAAFRSGGPVAVGRGERPAGRYWGVYATSNLFDLVAVTPLAGRLYSDGETGTHPAVLIREDLWEEQFDRDPGALGRVLRIDGVDHVVVGVLPQSFGFPIDHRLWMQSVESDGEQWSVAGRLGPNASPAVARDHLSSIESAIQPATESAQGTDDSAPTPPTLHVESFTTAHFSDTRPDETTRRIGLVSLLLLVLTGVNVAAVMVARGVSRSREVAVRMALGSSRWQVMALTLTEALLLSLAGGALGLLMGHAALQVMVQYLTGQATIVPYWMDFEVGAQSVLLAGALSLLALLAAGLIPAIRSADIDLDGALRCRRPEDLGGRIPAITAIVGLEVTLACFILSVSGVVIDEGSSLLQTGAAFPTDGIVTGHFVLEGPAYPDDEKRRNRFEQVLAAFRDEPRVQTVALSSALPGKDGTIRRAGPVTATDDPASLPPAQVRTVDGDFFSLLGISATAGRLLSDSDRDGTEPVAVVNEAFVRRHGLAGEATGQRVVVVQITEEEAYEATVVGVVDDRGVTPHRTGQPLPGVFLPGHQVTPVAAYVLLRTREPAAALPNVWHDAVTPLDPYLPLGDVLSLEETLRRGHGAATLFTSVFTVLGAVTLLVVLIGLHGVHAVSMARRVRELGIRRALGASSRRILRDSVRRGLRPVWIGVLVGSPAGLLVANSVVPVGLGLHTIVLPPAILVAASLLAVWRPTRRACRAHPLEALRED